MLGALRVRRLTTGALGFASVTVLAIACGSGNEGTFGSGGAGGGGLSGSSSTSTSTSSGTGGSPEQEVESSFGAPVATGRYVWIANPASGRVAYIDAVTLDIKLVDAGNGPTFVTAVPHPTDDVALVLNVLSADATLMRASASGLKAKNIAVPPSGNAWAVSSKGRFAIAWTDAKRIQNADPVEGYQDITVLDLTDGAERSFDLTVGYRPVAMAFDAAGTRAFAVTQDGVSVVALDGAEPQVIKNIGLTDDPAVDVGTPDVSITPDGSYALVRREGQSTMSVFSLADGARTDVTLPAPATDLDLSPDGAKAVAVLRSTSEVALAAVPGIVADPTAFSLVPVNATIGSVSLAPESPLAFLYTNATPSDLLAVLDTSQAAPTARTILLRAPILAVFPTPDASHALILHNELDDAGSHYPAAFSLAPIALDLPPKIIGLDAPVISVAIEPSGAHTLVATGDEMSGAFGLALSTLPSLKVKKLPLASMPIAAGIVAGAGKGFVAQKHPDGRITFVTLDTGETRTITGFELATQVVDGAP